MEVLVSIIVPIYNAEKVLERGVECLTQQTYRNIEIILVDDCSTDNSLEVCRRLAGEDSRIRVIQQEENRGSGAARNIGLTLALGKYITFFDVDDMCSTTVIAANVAIAEKYQSDIVMWGTQPVSSEKDIAEYEMGHCTEVKTFVADTAEKCHEKWLELKFLSGNVYIGAPWNKLYRREFLQTNNLMFPDTRRLQDSIFNIRCFNLVERFAINLQKHYYYFFNSQEVLWKKIHIDFIDNVVEYCKTIKTTIEDWGLDTEEIRTKIDNEFFGFLYCAMEACRNPKWNLSLKNKYRYLRKTLENPYVCERIRTFSVSDPEFIFFSKLCRIKSPLMILIFVYIRPIYYKVRRACGRVVRKLLRKT